MPEPAGVMGGMCTCTFGTGPATLNVLPTPRVMIESMPAATIQDSTIINVPSFIMCMTPSNPEVAAATAAALGVLTPMPCVPVLTPWVPLSPQALIGGQPALVEGATCNCAWGGLVTLTMAGSIKTLE
jgi:hypothetical protein